MPRDSGDADDNQERIEMSIRAAEAAEKRAKIPVLQDPDTAPKDGSWIIGAFDSGYVGLTLRYRTTRYDKSRSAWMDESGDYVSDSGSGVLRSWLPMPDDLHIDIPPYIVIFWMGGNKDGKWLTLTGTHERKDMARVFQNTLITAGRPAYIKSKRELSIYGMPEGPPQNWDFKEMKWKTP